MARVHYVKKARKARPDIGVKVGDPYYWWKTRTTVGKSYVSQMHYSKDKPKPSQLTRSEYMGQLMDLEAQGFDRGSRDDAVASFNSMAEEVRALGEEQADKLSNMPDGLQQSETGELLQARADKCEEIASALEDAANELENWTPDEVEADEDGDQDDSEAEKADAEADDEGWLEAADDLWGGIDWSPE